MNFCKHVFPLATVLAIALGVYSTAQANRLDSHPVIIASALLPIDSPIHRTAVTDAQGDAFRESDSPDQHRPKDTKQENAKLQDTVAQDDNAWEWDATKTDLANNLDIDGSVFDTQLPNTGVVRVPEPSTLILGAFAGLSILFRRRK